MSLARYVKQYVLENDGQTIAQIREAIIREHPNAKPKTIRTSLDRLKDKGIIYLKNMCWYVQAGVNDE